MNFVISIQPFNYRFNSQFPYLEHAVNVSQLIEASPIGKVRGEWIGDDKLKLATHPRDCLRFVYVDAKNFGHSAVGFT